jgi:hypothetical protein
VHKVSYPSSEVSHPTFDGSDLVFCSGLLLPLFFFLDTGASLSLEKVCCR